MTDEIVNTLNSITHRLRSQDRFKSCLVPGSDKEGFTPTYRNALAKDRLWTTLHPKLDTLDKLFQNSVNLFGSSNFLGHRRLNNLIPNGLDDFFTFETYQEINKRKHNVASGIIHLVSTHPSYMFTNESSTIPEFVVSIYSKNNIEWILLDLASRSVSLPNTALYDTLGKSSSKYILEVTESPILFATKDKLSKVIELKMKKSIPKLLYLVSIESLNEKTDELLFNKAKTSGLILIDFETLETVGSNHKIPEDFNPPTPETIYTYSFTSGTTGNPKGVTITHNTAVVAITSCFASFPKPISNFNEKNLLNIRNNKRDDGEQLRGFSMLPLAHIYERQFTNYSMALGFAIGMPSSSNPKSLFSDIKIIKPSHLASVPRIWNSYELIIRSMLRNFNMKSPKSIRSVDKLLVSNLIRKALGFDHLKYIITGSAPLSLDTLRFLKEHLCVGVVSAYGSTESFAGVSFTDADNEEAVINIGPPGVSTEMKLIDVPTMGYTSQDKPMARGELLLRGPQIFKNYFKNKVATEKSFDENGWFYTGDIAAIDSNGAFYIIDRVKNFFKLSQGEFVSPEKIENTYLSNSPLLTQLFVHGEGSQNYLVGIAGISADYAKKFLKDQYGLDTSQDKLLQMLKNLKVKKAMIQELNKHVKDCELQGFEKIHNIYFDFEPLRVQDDVLTPTLKLKRNVAKKRFAAVLKDLYKEGSLYKNEKL